MCSGTGRSVGIAWRNFAARWEESMLVIDLACRKRAGILYRHQPLADVYPGENWTKGCWMTLPDTVMNSWCMGVDVEGKASGIEEDLVSLLGRQGGIPITYAGGIGSPGRPEPFPEISGGSLDFTIGSALDLFGGYSL